MIYDKTGTDTDILVCLLFPRLRLLLHLQHGVHGRQKQNLTEFTTILHAQFFSARAERVHIGSAVYSTTSAAASSTAGAGVSTQKSLQGVQCGK
jgi:hypothetical protein